MESRCEREQRTQIRIVAAKLGFVASAREPYSTIDAGRPIYTSKKGEPNPSRNRKEG